MPHRQGHMGLHFACAAVMLIETLLRKLDIARVCHEEKLKQKDAVIRGPYLIQRFCDVKC